MRTRMCVFFWFAASILILAFAAPYSPGAEILSDKSPAKGESIVYGDSEVHGAKAEQFAAKGLSQGNAPPDMQLPPDTTVSICPGDSVCFDLFASDPDAGDSITVEKIAGAGTYPPVSDTTPISNTHCFHPVASGPYMFIFKVTDKGGLSDTDTTTITVDVNQPPVVTAADTVIFDLCDTATVCFRIIVSDPDDDLNDLTYEVNPPGFISTCQYVPGVCFFAGWDTTYNFVIVVTDPCGSSDTAYTAAIVIMNDPPVVTAPDTVKYNLSDTATVCFDISISDPDDITHQVGCTPPGEYNASDTSICFFADHDATYDFTIIVADSCGQADTAYTTAVVEFVGNRPPVLAVPADVDTFLCEPETLCFTVEATDPDPGDSIILEKIEGPGAFAPDTGVSPLSDSICFLPENVDSTYRFIFRATDKNAASDKDSFYVTVDLNQLPTVVVPADTSLFLSEAETLCFEIEFSDPDDSVEVSVNSPWYYDSEDSSICIFATDETTYCCSVIVTDECDVADTGTMCLTVHFSAPPTVEVLSPPSGDTLSYLPTLSIKLKDDLGLDRGFYQIDSCTGTWTEFWSYNSNSSDTTIDWTVPAVPEGLHTIYFKVTDDSGAVNPDTCSYSWSFTYLVPMVSIIPELLSARCNTDYILWIHMDEKITDLDSAFFRISYDASYLAATNVLKGPALIPSSDFEVSRVIYPDSIFISLSAVTGAFDGPGQILGLIVTPGTQEVTTQVNIAYSSLRDSAGQEIIHQTAGSEISISCVVSVGEDDAAQIPSDYKLNQNCPNPYNSETRIAYQLPQPGNVSLRVYNIKGQLIRTLVEGYKPAGNHVAVWDSRNQDGIKVSSGIYFYRLRAGGFTDTKKMVLLK